MRVKYWEVHALRLQANSRLVDTYMACEREGWTIPSQLQYLGAIECAVSIYATLDPADSFLENLRSLARKIRGILEEDSRARDHVRLGRATA